MIANFIVQCATCRLILIVKKSSRNALLFWNHTIHYQLTPQSGVLLQNLTVDQLQLFTEHEDSLSSLQLPPTLSHVLQSCFFRVHYPHNHAEVFQVLSSRQIFRPPSRRFITAFTKSCNWTPPDLVHLFTFSFPKIDSIIIGPPSWPSWPLLTMWNCLDWYPNFARACCLHFQETLKMEVDGSSETTYFSRLEYYLSYLVWRKYLYQFWVISVLDLEETNHILLMNVRLNELMNNSNTWSLDTIP
jgi:hypothetical protein